MSTVLSLKQERKVAGDLGLILDITDNETHFLKGCLDYGLEPTDFIAAWPEDQACVTIADFLIFSNDFTTASEAGECKTINCQECVFPFKYNGEEYNQCITVDSDNKVPWCAVQVR